MNRNGFTLLEMLLAVSIIGMLAVVLIPTFNLAMRSRQNALCANKLRMAVEAFELYAADEGAFPPSGQPGVIPPLMADYYFPYFKIDWWGNTTELGGNWSWNIDLDGIHASVSINAPTALQPQMTDLDRLIDDGNLATGRFRQVGTKYNFIIEN